MDAGRITPVLMPKWGLSMKEGLLGEWLVTEGDEVSVGDEIMEVETDKIASAVEAADAGILRRCVGEAGVTYPVRALMAVMAPADVSDAEVDDYIAAYQTPVDEEGEDDPGSSGYEFVETPAGRLRFARRGDAGPVVILIHGFGGDLDNWLFNIDALAQKAIVFALDLPGHGQSSKQLVDGSLGGLAGALRAFMSAVDLESAHLVGHSMGAAVAARLACDSPELVRSLSLISAAGLGKEINSAYIDGFVGAESRRELKPVLFHLFADTDLVNRSMVDDLLKYKRIDGVQDALEEISSHLFANNTQHNVLTQQVPVSSLDTLVIWGAEDTVIPASQAHNLESARVEIIDNAGHMVQMEQAAMVNELLLGHILA